MILVIGGMGFIGMNTTRELLARGEQVTITQHSANRVPDVLAEHVGKSLFTERMDVTNTFEVLDVVRRTKADSIISFAAPPARGLSAHQDYQIYTQGLQNVLEAARASGLRRVTLASSTSVYGSLPAGPFREDAGLPTTSKTQIEAFKKGMEIHALHYADRAGLDVACVRIGSIYGPLYYSMFNPMSRMVHAALKGEAPSFADRPGGMLNDADQGDWTHVEDLARGIAAVHLAKALPNRVYNVGSGKATSNKQILAAVQAALPNATCPSLKPGRTPGNPENPVMDISRAKADVGYEPRYDITSGIGAYVEWLRSHPQ
ncbi:MAG: NAD(P)-dependent oxidoreductase [Chloroflexota bacterium]